MNEYVELLQVFVDINMDSNLPTDSRKRMLDKVRIAVNMTESEFKVINALHKQWTSAPTGSLWKKAVCETLFAKQEMLEGLSRAVVLEVRACQLAAAAIKERKAKDNPGRECSDA